VLHAAAEEATVVRYDARSLDRATLPRVYDATRPVILTNVLEVDREEWTNIFTTKLGRTKVGEPSRETLVAKLPVSPPLCVLWPSLTVSRHAFQVEYQVRRDVDGRAEIFEGPLQGFIEVCTLLGAISEPHGVLTAPTTPGVHGREHPLAVLVSPQRGVS
jgi:hypothetical protein